jgi:hypothetical protein
MSQNGSPKFFPDETQSGNYWPQSCLFPACIQQICAEFIDNSAVKNTTVMISIACLSSGQYYEYFPASSLSLRYPVPTSDTQDAALGCSLF